MRPPLPSHPFLLPLSSGAPRRPVQETSNDEVRGDGETLSSIPTNDGSRGELGMPTATLPSSVCCCIRLSNRSIGFLLAMGCGLWGGSLPTPLKLAERATPDVPVGFAFVTSFGISVAIVTACVWLGYLAIAVRGLGLAWPSMQPKVRFWTSICQSFLHLSSSLF